MAKSARNAAQGRRSRRWVWVLALVALLLGAGAWAYSGSISGNAQAGTAYMARVACSCRFVSDRSLEDCGKDKLAGMELVTLVEDADAKSVTARFPLLSSDTATYRQGYGCVLEPWNS